jgi:hypothetical protein
MTDLVMRKRAGRTGEIGLFVDTQVFEEDFGNIKMDAEVQVKATTPRSLRQLKFAWVLATKIAEACDWVETKEDCMDFMLIEAKHFRRIFDPLRGVAILKPKPTNFGAMDGTEYTRLLKRVVFVATTIMVPGMDDSALKAEIEAMIGPDLTPTAPAPKPRAARAKKSGAEAAARPDAPDHQEEVQETAGEGQGSELSNPSPKPSAPTNEAEYIQACMSWLKKQTDRFKAFDHFNGEVHRQMRLDLKISTGVRKSLERQIGEFFDGKDRESKGAAQAKGGRPQGDDRQPGSADQAVD